MYNKIITPPPQGGVVTNPNYDNFKDSKRLAERIFLSNLDSCKKFPKYIVLNTTDICNARCVMCPHSVDSKKLGTMKMELFLKILDELKNYSDWIERVSLFRFGEPLLDKDIYFRVEALKNIGIKEIVVSTNAQLLFPDATKKLMSAGVTDLRFSVDAFSKEVYEKIRVGLNYEKVMDNVKSAISIRNNDYPNVRIRLTYVEQPLNIQETSDFRSYWEKCLGEKDELKIVPYHSRENWSVGEKKSVVGDRACVSVFSTMAIDNDGSVVLCCMDSKKELRLGNLTNNTESIKSIWNSQVFDNIRMTHLQGGRDYFPFCKGCDAWEGV